MKIKKGDLVKVIAGAANKKGKIGRVIAVDNEAMRVTVEGVAVMKKHVKPQRDPKNPDGGIVETHGSVHVSNVMLMSEAAGRPVRVGSKFSDDGKKLRVAKGRSIKAEVI